MEICGLSLLMRVFMSCCVARLERVLCLQCSRSIRTSSPHLQFAHAPCYSPKLKAVLKSIYTLLEGALWRHINALSLPSSFSALINRTFLATLAIARSPRSCLGSLVLSQLFCVLKLGETPHGDVGAFWLWLWLWLVCWFSAVSIRLAVICLLENPRA